MPKIINRKKQIEGFTFLALSFMAIFAILAGVIFWNYSNSIYSNSDKVLEQYVNYYRQTNLLSQPTLSNNKKGQHSSPVGSFDDFRGKLLYYDKNQKQIISENVDTLAQSASAPTFKMNVPFDSLDLDLPPQTVKTSKGYIRAQAIKFKDNTLMVPSGSDNQMTYAKYAYVFVDATDTVINLRHFQDLIIWSFAFAFGLAVMFAFVISRHNMKPILKAWQQQQDFVNNAAHELRTPMSVIQGKLETMLTKPDSTVRDQSEAIILSLSEVRRLNSLTNNMLTLAKTGSNMTKIEKEPTDVASFLNKIMTPYREMGDLEGKLVELDVNVDRSVALDRKRIHQLLVLLLDNALKYSDTGATVKVSAVIEKKRLVLTVADTGRGISNEAKKHIFDRFYREDKTGNRETGGTGLGLSIAEWIVQAHNGRIIVSDNQPQGTIFKVSLPL